MNRRAFLLAVSAAACGGPPRRQHRVRQPPPSKATPISSDFIGAAVIPQLKPSPIAIQGALLFQIAGDELSLWDTTTMTRTAGLVGAYRQACFLRDGTLAAFAVPPGSFKSELHRIDANGTREVLVGPLFGTASAGVTRVLPAGAPDQIYVTRRYEIVLYRMARNELHEVMQFRPSPTEPVSNQVLSLGDGRLLTTAGRGFEIIDPAKPPVRLDAAGRKPLLVAAAAGERIWYSHATGHWATQVVLTSLRDPAAIVHALDFPTSRVTHLAAGNGALALLTMSLKAPDGAQYLWTLGVFDEAGTSRWQVTLPEDIAEPGATNVAIDWMRAAGTRSAVTVSVAGDAAEDARSDAPNAAEAMVIDAERRRLAAALAGLPERMREAVLLRYFDGLSEHAMSAQLGIPQGTVKSRLSNAVTSLRRSLVEEVPDGDA